MILSDVTAAIAVYFADALERGGRPIGAVNRYVGETDDDCCSKDSAGQTVGSLRINVPRLGSANTPPNIFAEWGRCPAVSVAELNIRVMRCWPTGTHSAEVWDLAASEQMDDAWILGCSAKALMDDNSLLNLCDEDGRRIGCKMGGWVVTPVDPSGACAGNVLQMFVSLTGPCSVIEDSGS